MVTGGRDGGAGGVTARGAASWGGITGFWIGAAGRGGAAGGTTGFGAGGGGGGAEAAAGAAAGAAAAAPGSGGISTTPPHLRHFTLVAVRLSGMLPYWAPHDVQVPMRSVMVSPGDSGPVGIRAF